MSKKNNFLELIKQIRLEHKKWVNQIHLMVSGLETNKDAIALNPSESAFGEWLYSKAMAYSITNSNLVLNDMETLFNECYNEYHKIYAVLFKRDEGNILNSLFGSKRASASDYKIAAQYYETLVKTSDKLLNKLRIYESQLTATNFEKFDRALHDEDIVQEPLLQTPKQKEQRYYRGSLIED